MRSSSGIRQVTSVIWALISDGDQAYVFKYSRNDTVVAVRNAWKKPVRKKQYIYGEAEALSTPSFGRYGATERFVRSVAGKINLAHYDGSFDYLVIVAPRDTLKGIHEFLNGLVQDRLLANMPDGYVYDKKGALMVVRKETPARFVSHTASYSSRTLNTKIVCGFTDQPLLRMGYNA
ncbi:MAG: hypothetical protein PHY92_06550 [Alphaproteobacteria bacterium]|nr:hypothetical protein [Alphaproteobacteria bacterium]